MLKRLLIVSVFMIAISEVVQAWYAVQPAGPEVTVCQDVKAGWTCVTKDVPEYLESLPDRREIEQPTEIRPTI